MQILEGLPPFEGASTPPVGVALGNFDGVHRGHRLVVEAAGRAAAQLGIAQGVVTFEPHPRELFQADAPPFRLTSPEQKARKLAQLGVQRLYVLPFEHRLSSLSPSAFAKEVLAEGLNTRHVVVGRDFRFGKGRTGDVAMLAELGRDCGFAVEVIDKVGSPELNGEPFSSSAARAALREGRPEEAARILGDWHKIDGIVLQGDQRGRVLGYPTANQALPDGVLHPAYGIYAVKVEVRDGPHRGRYDGVASMGLRPTFDKTVPNFETFLFDFSGDLYGAELSVALCAYLRPEVKFDGLEPLIAQMDQDASQARRILATLQKP